MKKERDWHVLLCRPGRAADRCVGSADTLDGARELARALNRRLNEEEGLPRHGGGPFAFHYVVGPNRCCSNPPASLARLLDGEAEGGCADARE